jgi:hypothetical protein
MKTLIISLSACALIALAFFALKPSATQPAKLGNLPWQITPLSSGGTEVFGIRPGATRIDEALKVLGEDHDLAVIMDKQDHAGLEVYFSHFKAGPLAGKLILSAQIDSDSLEAMAAGAGKSSYMASGSRKFQLNSEDLQRAQALILEGISFIPAASLSKDIVEQRFGLEYTLVESEDSQYFLYPILGLSITLNKDAKEVLQYVHPEHFSLVSEPLKSLSTKFQN